LNSSFIEWLNLRFFPAPAKLGIVLEKNRPEGRLIFEKGRPKPAWTWAMKERIV
jgi:hypothetical protein